MAEGNPLVAEAKKDPNGPGPLTAGNGDYGWAGGIGLAETSMDAFNGIKDGDWVSGGLGMLSLAGEIAGAAIDPFGYLMSSVASFLMEHVQPLKDMLDSLAGNPPVIQSYADTWGNVSKALGERKTDFDNAVKNGTTGWTGEGADAYRKSAAEHSDALSGAATVAGAIGTVTMLMGQVVSFVRETVRQLIADLVGKLISWVMEEVFSLGFGTPVVVAQASAAIAKWGKKIGDLLKKLTDTIRKVSPLLSKLVDIFEKIAKVFGKVLGKVSGLHGLKVKEGGFVHRIPKEGGGVHARPHGGSDGEGSHSGDGNGSRGGDGDNSSGGDGSPSRTGNGESPSPRGGDGSPSGDGPSAIRSDDSGTPRTRSGDSGSAPTHGGDGASSHVGDSGSSPTRSPSHAGDSGPAPTRGGDGASSHVGDSGSSPTRSPSHAGDSGPAPTHAGDNTPSHRGDSAPSRSADTNPSPPRAGDSNPAPTHSGSPSHAAGDGPAHSGAPGSHAGADAPGSRAGADTLSSAAPPRTDGTTSSGTAPTAPRTGDPGTQFPSPRGGDGAAASGIPPQGGGPTPGGGMPPGGAPGAAPGGAPGGGSPRAGGGPGWTGTPGSPGARTPDLGAPGRPRPGGDLPEGRPRPGGDTARQRVPETPAPAARGFGPGTHGPDTRPGGHGPGGRPGGPDGGPHGHEPHENGPGHHDTDGAGHHGDSEPLTPDEVNARHSESTPSGTSYHAGDPEMGDLPHRVQPDPHGRYTVDVHVTPDGHARIGDRLYTPEEFADILRRNGDYDGRPIRLIGCDAGSNDFAHRLSRELDTEVLAPSKPAWTDSHGRVFSSDYEIGPDGRMRPRIPPDGEWTTHHPDGSVHRAGSDGFAPDSHHGDPHDVDADSAHHRGERYIDDEPVDIEHPDREPKATMKEKINDDAYREKYYDGPNKNGEYSRKNADQTDAVDDRLPKIKEDKTKPEGDRFEPKSDDFEEATYHKQHEVEHTATPHQKDEAQDLIDRRHEANQRAREAEADYQDAKKSGTVDEEIERERSEAHRDRTDLGEELGEHAARDAIADKFPPPDHQIKELPDPDIHGDNTRLGDKPGSGRFDQIYEVTGPDGKPKIVVVEAKGPNAGLGTRQGPTGDPLRYEQGHPKYVDSIIENMRRNGTEAEQNLAEDLARAKRKGNLDYYVAKARVRDEVELDGAGKPVPDPDNPGQSKKRPVYGGYNLKHFDLSARPPKNR
ncbi:hypothetical protein ORV05_21250 [Amycolatopsis cynarae]|uniref:Uncharacterized protein n=1 Tax=Amycolatopsis cynarae TaxID=2995223 RepID=A0ABY7AX95_9PSEU|nr:hypothetical protein [Amycolatopsis sp. HUAS 11-8]WAL63532.1 hypothetical protein ORV05_21250 [Amycolatopsis sp. HUAS 11-8]